MRGLLEKESQSQFLDFMREKVNPRHYILNLLRSKSTKYSYLYTKRLKGNYLKDGSIKGVA
jgi:hypothetical protein